MSPPLTLGFARAFVDVPRPVGVQLFARMDEILHTVNAIPRGSTIWESLAASWLVVNIADWRFHYRIDAANNKLVVVAAAKAERSTTG